MTIIAQDPSVRVGRDILTETVHVPAEELEPGPRGYRVHVIDYDSSANRLYKPRSYRDMKIAAPFATQRQAAAASLPPIREPSFPSGAG